MSNREDTVPIRGAKPIVQASEMLSDSSVWIEREELERLRALAGRCREIRLAAAHLLACVRDRRSAQQAEEMALVSLRQVLDGTA